MPKIRTQTPSEIELVILDKSRRRCALCFHLSGDLHEQHGQIAHLDQNPANYAEDNLAFLCLPHHSVYDSKTSQHKNYTLAEVKAARDRLYTAIDEGRHALNAPVDPYHNQKTIVKDLHPALIGTIEQTIFGEMNGNAICIVNMGIKNTGSPTIVDGWQFVVRKYGDTYPGRISAAPGNMNTLQFDDYNNARIIVQQADAIYEKTISNPIPTGGQVLGWIVAIVVGINRERLNTEGTIVEVSYKDVRGNSYVASHSIRKTDALGVARYVPGSGGQWEDPRRR